MQTLRIILLALLTLATIARAEFFEILDTGIQLEGPQGFTVMTAEEIQAKFPKNRPPIFAIGNENRSTTVALNFRDDPMPAEALPAFMEKMGKLLEKIVPGIEWKERKMIEMGGRKWIYLEMTSQAVDTDIHNIMLITSFRGKMLGLNFNSTKAEFPKVEEELRKSIKSIALPEK